jgi:hypothetical protein
MKSINEYDNYIKRFVLETAISEAANDMAKKKIHMAVQSATKRVIKDPKVYVNASPEQKKSMKDKIKSIALGALGGLGVGGAAGYSYGFHKGYEQFPLDVAKEIDHNIKGVVDSMKGFFGG